jgi:hypothetical protein
VNALGAQAKRPKGFLRVLSAEQLSAIGKWRRMQEKGVLFAHRGIHRLVKIGLAA